LNYGIPQIKNVDTEAFLAIIAGGLSDDFPDDINDDGLLSLLSEIGKRLIIRRWPMRIIWPIRHRLLNLCCKHYLMR
jgi:hypothetical protein